MFLLLRFFLLGSLAVVTPNLFVGCSSDDCQHDRDCGSLQKGYACRFVGGAKKCVDTTRSSDTPSDGEAPPDGEAAHIDKNTTHPDDEALPSDDKASIEAPPIETSIEASPIEAPPTETSLRGSSFNTCIPIQGSPTGTCQAGLICLGITQTEARCFQDCTDNQAVCAANTDGRTNCEVVTQDGSVSVCLNNNATEGQACGFGNKSQARCKEDTTTPNVDLYCSTTTQKCTKPDIKKNVGDPCNRENDNSEPLKLCDRGAAKPLACDPNTGTCIEQTIVGTLEKCGGVKGCGNDDVCVGFDDGNGGTVSYCLKKCTPGPTSTCPGSAECLTLNSGGGACRWAGSLQQNAACQQLDTTKDKIDTAGLCAGGLQCIGLNGTKAICIQIWEGTCTTPGKTCGTGTKCVGLQSSTGTTFGGCFSDCAGGKACPIGLECSTDLGDACLAEIPIGPIGLGDICSKATTKATTEGCQKGLFCLGLTGASNGVCSKDCGVDPSTCNGATGGTMTCIEINPSTGAKACVFPCSQAGQTCPTGTTCNSGAGVCLP
ncbi:hypothetical protein L6R29_23770 [Myxococcota bacterium]|nr:hypothetical protein [Myxococcota bacterium]